MTKELNRWALAAMILSMSISPLSAFGEGSSAPFTDFSAISPDKVKSVQAAVSAGLLSGYPDGRFLPEQTVTRQEMAVLLARALQLQTDTEAESTFSDTQNLWSSAYIEAVRKAGLMDGDDNNAFHPYEPINREQLAVVLDRAVKAGETQGVSLRSASDLEQVSSWAKKAVEKALRFKLIPSDDSSFHPQSPVQRQEAAGILLDMLQKNGQTGVIDNVDGDVLTVAGVNYVIDEELRSLFSEKNKQALLGAVITYSSMNRHISEPIDLEITSSGTSSAPVSLDVSGGSFAGTLRISGDYVSIQADALKRMDILNGAAHVNLNAHVQELAVTSDQPVNVTGSGTVELMSSTGKVNVGSGISVVKQKMDGGASEGSSSDGSGSAPIVSGSASSGGRKHHPSENQPGSVQVLQSVNGNTVLINGVTYTLSDEARKLLRPENAAVLNRAQISFESSGKTLNRITSLEITQSGAAPAEHAPEFSGNLVLDGGEGTIDGNLTLSGDYLTVNHLKVNGDFVISEKLGNDFSSNGLVVTGRTVINGGDSNTVVFEDASLDQVTVNKQNVRVETKGSSTVTQLDIAADATLVNEASSTIGNVTVQSGAFNVALEGSISSLELNGSNATTITGDASIGELKVNTASEVTLTSGTVQQLVVNNANASVSLGKDANIGEVSLASNVPATSVKTPDNQAPVATRVLANLTIPFSAGDAAVDIDKLFEDPDGDKLTIGALSSDKTVIKPAISDDKLKLTPLKGGTSTITLRANDGKGHTISVTFIATVNMPPVVEGLNEPIGLETGGAASEVKLNDAFKDPENDSIVYTAIEQDATVAAAVVTNGTLTISPLKAGETTIQVTATDTYNNKTTKTIQVKVAQGQTPPPPANQAPQGTAIPAATVEIGGAAKEIDLSQYFTDPENEAITYAAVSQDTTIAGAAVNGSKLTIDALAAGTTTVDITATDARGARTTGTVSVTVTSKANQAPQGTAIPAATMEIGGAAKEIDLSQYFTDPENEAITYSAVSQDTTIAKAAADGSKLTINALAAGTTTVDITATDARGAKTTGTVSVTVTAASEAGPAPEVVASIQTQLLCPGYTDARDYDLSQLFNDPLGDVLIYTAVSSDPDAAKVTVNGSQLTLAPGTVGHAGNAAVTIKATNSKGKSATYDLNVVAVKLVANGFVDVKTKSGVPNLTYDLSPMFPGQSSFSVYFATPQQTLAGPTTLNGKTWTSVPMSGDNWVVGASGNAVLLRVSVSPQVTGDPYFIQYVDGGDYNKSFEIRNPVGGASEFKGYQIEIYHYDTKAKVIKSTVAAVPDEAPLSNPGYLINAIDGRFYDFMDFTKSPYYNLEVILNIPDSNLTAVVLKKDSRIVDVLGDPNSHDAFLPSGGTIIRKSSINSPSKAFSLTGEWNIYPAGTYQFYGQQTP